MTIKLLTTRQAAARLGVTPQTLYAYVSRGVVTRTLAADGRTSRFDPAEIDALALRSRPRAGARRAGRVQVSMASRITQLTPETLRYRGRDVVGLCDEGGFECVAHWLWTGAWEPDRRFEVRPDRARRAAALARVLPKDAPAIERFGVLCSGVACLEPARVDLRPEVVSRHMGELVGLLASSLPAAAPTRGGRSSSRRAEPDTSIARMLCERLSPLPPTKARIAAMDRALVLLADHELATSTLAVRVAASTRADPYSAVAAGLAAASGRWHGKAASGVHRLLLEAEREGHPEPVAIRAFEERDAGILAGLGHPVYTGEDPRGRALWTAFEGLDRGGRLDRATRLRDVLESHTGRKANVDFALAVLAYLADMPVGATDAIFVLARVAGWVAHALEEYEETPLRFRARATYEGP